MRSLLGVLVGLVLAAGLMIGTNQQLVKFTPPTTALFFALTLAGAALFHLLAGFVCAAIARDQKAAVWALIVLGTALLLTSVKQTWNQMPPWYSLAMVVIVPVALWLGAQAHRHRALSSLPAAAR